MLNMKLLNYIHLLSYTHLLFYCTEKRNSFVVLLNYNIDY
jgi:hypothetical protein